MEDTLGVRDYLDDEVADSLNPCFNGRYSRSKAIRGFVAQEDVLILVLMEDTLGENHFTTSWYKLQCLNPCFNGRYSRRAKTYISLFIAV